MSTPLRVLSLGAGVQSSTLLRMSLAGELPRLDAAIFADTGWEPAAVYAHLQALEADCAAADVPLVRVGNGNLRADAINSSSGRRESWRSVNMPLYLTKADGSPGGVLMRQCTTMYKIRPIRAAIRERLAAAGVKQAEMWLGISVDEVQRARTSDVRYIAHRYPLLERRMTRADCLAWLQHRGFARPPKSACIGCPYRNRRSWRDLRDHAPAEWADAVDFDAQIRHMDGIRGQAFLHGSLVPLAMADLSTPQERGQVGMFEGEGAVCDGGVCFS